MLYVYPSMFYPNDISTITLLQVYSNIQIISSVLIQLMSIGTGGPGSVCLASRMQYTILSWWSCLSNVSNSNLKWALLFTQRLRAYMALAAVENPIMSQSGLVTSYGTINLGQHWLNLHVAWHYQTITCTNVELSPTCLCCPHHKTISHGSTEMILRKGVGYCIVTTIIFTFSGGEWSILPALLADRSQSVFKCVNYLRPNDAYIRQETNLQWFRSWLVTWPAPGHYLNQCWNIVNWILGKKLQ